MKERMPSGVKLLYGGFPRSPMTPRCLPRWAFLNQPETRGPQEEIKEGSVHEVGSVHECVKGNHEACGITH